MTTAIKNGNLRDADNRAAFVREVVAFYEGILPCPSTSEYEAISRQIVEKYPCLQDSRSSKYWVRTSNFFCCDVGQKHNVNNYYYVANHFYLNLYCIIAHFQQAAKPTFPQPSPQEI